jgi:cell division protein FtsL
MNWLQVTTVFLLIAILSSATAVVVTKQKSRVVFVELQKVERIRNQLDIEWGQIQLEQETWSTHNRIETIAVEQLGLEMPTVEQLVLLNRK